MGKSGKAQSSMEYLVTYGWAILIIAIVVSLLYLYVIVPSTVVPSSCTFVSGAYCNNIIVGTNLQTHVTKLAVFLTNTQPYPLANPALIVRTGNVNSTPYACSPTFVLAGGSVVCTVTLPVQTSLSQFLAGSFYLTGTYCGLSSNYQITHTCTGQVQTYSGSFTSHVQPLINTNNIVLFTAQNTTNPANNAKDPLRATVLLLGYPLKGATVNFTENVTSYKLQPNLTTTNTTGVALSYIWGTRTGNVMVNAVYAGISNSITIQFTPPTVLLFSVSGFAYCGQDSATMVVIDGTPYTCAQWLSSPLACGAGSSHTYNFSRTVSISSSIREIFNKVIVNGISSTSNHSTIICPSANESIIANYTTQFYLTETSNPAGGAATLTPGSNWYNNGSVQTLSETANPGYFFNSWSCTGTGCYTGSLTSTSLPVNAVISETVNYYSTTSTSTTSTSTSTTTTSTSTTSTTTITQTYNPPGGNYNGDIIYSQNTQLSSPAIASNMILVESGVSVNEYGNYLQGNASFYNYGTVTDAYSGGAGGAGGSGGYYYDIGNCNSPQNSAPTSGKTGASGVSKVSHFISQTLAGGTGGGGGGGGGQGTCTADVPGLSGGKGGNGGGIVEIYASAFNNYGILNASGFPGGSGSQGNGCYSSGGGGGAGSGGNGGTIMIGYSNSITLGTVYYSGGPSGWYTTNNINCGVNGGGSGGGDAGGGGGGGGYAGDTGNNGAAGAFGACGGTGSSGVGGNGCTGTSAPSSGTLIEKVWTH